MVDQLAETRQMLAAIVDHWCPKQFDHEPFQVRQMRALMECNVTAMGAKAKIDGKDCVRPYEICTQAPESFEQIIKATRNPI